MIWKVSPVTVPRTLWVYSTLVGSLIYSLIRGNWRVWLADQMHASAPEAPSPAAAGL